MTYTLKSTVLLAMSASLLGTARAQEQEAGGTPALPEPELDTVPNESPSRVPLSTDRSFRLPLSILDQKDTELLRQLLLSHGVEWNLDSTLSLDSHRFAELVDDLTQGTNLQSRAAAKEIAANTVQNRGLIPEAVKLRNTVAQELRSGVTPETGVSREWNVVWLGDPPVTSLDGPETTREIAPERDPTTAPAPSTSPGPASTDLFLTDDAPPPGFESLAEPVTLLVDVYFLREKVGQTSITASTDYFLLDDPQSVLELLDGIKEPQRLLVALTGKLDSNIDKICLEPNDPPGCGTVTGDPLAAIYDESLLKVEFFVSKDSLYPRQRQVTRYLPDPETGRSSIFSLGAVASRIDDEEDRLDLSGRALVSYGRGHISAEADYESETDRRRLQSFRLTHYYNDHELVAGTYSFSPGGALRSLPMVGASFSTTLRTRVDLQHALGSELSVHLENHALVQLVVDGRVYAGASYAAGNRVLDTSALPEGTYEVEIRIQDPVTGPETLYRQFTKSALIPPRGEVVASMALGVPLLFVDDEFLPETTRSEILGFSIGRRINDHSAFQLGMLQAGEQTLVNPELTYLSRDFSIRMAFSFGTKKTLASSLRASYSRNKLRASFAAETFKSTLDPLGDKFLERLYPDDFQQYSFNVSNSFSNFTLGASANYRKREGSLQNEYERRFALFYRRPITRWKPLRGSLDIELEQEEDVSRLTVGTRFYLSQKQRSSRLETRASRDNNGNNGYLAGVGTEWRTEPGRSVDILLGAHTNVQDEGQEAGLSLGLKHRRFRSSLNTQVFSRNNGEDQKSAVVSAGAHWGLDNRGIAMGGSDVSQAGVILSVSGEPQGERFDVIVNNLKYSVGTIGSTQFVGLQPFENYEIKLVPHSLTNNGLSGEVYEFSLFPGTVQRIEIQARRQYLLIGTLVNRFGELIEHALVEDQINPVTIDASGLIQAEVSAGETIRVRLADGSVCQFEVPDSDEQEIMVVDEPIVCLDADS